MRRKSRHNRYYSPEEAMAVIANRAGGLTYQEIGDKIGRTRASVKGFVGRNVSVRPIEWPIGR